MNIREPRDFEGVRHERQARHRWLRVRRAVRICAITIVGLIVLAYLSYLRPVPKVEAKVSLPAVSAEQVALTWPNSGQAALGIQGQGVLATTVNQHAVPTASVAKVMLSLAVLKKYPLQPGQSGPMITVSADDLQRYNQYVGENGSVVRVQVDEQISEYQALQAVLLASGNNIADMLAIWSYGSMDQYLQAANQIAQGLGMTQSTFAVDASGYHPETVSTPHDLILLGQAALDQPLLKAIVAQKSADIPVAGTVVNTNVLLGHSGIIGIKTGNSDQAGGCYLFAAEHTLPNGKSIVAVGAIMGSPSIGQAMVATPPLLDSFYQAFTNVTAVSKGQTIARYQAPWGASTAAVAAANATVLNWPSSKVSLSAKTEKISSPAAAVQPAGTVTAQTAYGQVTIPLVTTTALPAPTWQWRVWRN